MSEREVGNTPEPGPAAQEERRGVADAERVRRMIEHIEDYAIFMLDAEGRVATWNEGARRIKGWTAEEIVGQPYERFFPEEDARAGKPARLLRAATEQGRIEDQGWRLRKDGARFWADAVITALRDDAGRLTGFAKVTRDLTARREVEERLRQSEERFRLLVDAIQDYAIFMLDPSGDIVTWNAGAERMYGYAADEVRGRHFMLLCPEEDRGRWEEELACAARRGRYEYEGQRVRKGGERFWANVVVSAVHDPGGQLAGYAKVTRDLTERHRAEDERLRLERAREAIRLRDEFLSVASHELKTPVTALRLQLQALRDQVARRDPALRPRAERAAETGERIVQLIDALLDVSRIATGRFELHPAPLDLAPVVQAAAARLEEAASRAGCTLTVSGEPGLIGVWDQLRIEQVVMNLVANAIKYAPDAPIRVAVTADAGGALLEVSDGGPGIAETDLPRIFGRFERAATNPNLSGMGLGLWVARTIAEAHGGTIAATNLPRGGACFRVWLPLVPSMGPRPRTSWELH